jgi:tetratricopeptide (TPR) repeat protein
MSGKGTAGTLAEIGGAILAIAGVSLIANAMVGRLQPQIEAAVGMNRAQQEKLEQSAAASLLGQFRSSISDFLWLKADKYLHNGIELRGLTPQEKESGHADSAISAPGEKEKGYEEHEEETTVIPSRRNDWRGHLGDIERKIQPYQDMENHEHKDPKEALPLFRLMTAANPRFIPGYTSGAMLIAQDRAKVEEAVNFLREGAANNPESIEIHNAIGYMMTSRQHKYKEAFPYLLRALELAAAKDPTLLTEDELENHQEAFRWAVLNRREAGEPAAARRLAEACLAAYPDDVVCRRYMREHPK